MEKTREVLVKYGSYSIEEVARATKTAIDLLGGVQAFIPEDRRRAWDAVYAG